MGYQELILREHCYYFYLFLFLHESVKRVCEVVEVVVGRWRWCCRWRWFLDFPMWGAIVTGEGDRDPARRG